MTPDKDYLECLSAAEMHNHRLTNIMADEYLYYLTFRFGDSTSPPSHAYSGTPTMQVAVPFTFSAVQFACDE